VSGRLDNLERVRQERVAIFKAAREAHGYVVSIYWQCASAWTSAAQSGVEPRWPSAPPAQKPASVGGPDASQQDAERHLRGLLEREGATDAKCTKKQYGSSWVTVCE
jgi:hypothetical protein